LSYGRALLAMRDWRLGMSATEDDIVRWTRVRSPRIPDYCSPIKWDRWGDSCAPLPEPGPAFYRQIRHIQDVLIGDLTPTRISHHRRDMVSQIIIPTNWAHALHAPHHREKV